MTPRQLYGKLLTMQYSPVPKGYYSAKVGTAKLDDRMKRHHAVGVVQVTLSSDGAIHYFVFPSKRDAFLFNRDRNYDEPDGVKVVRMTEMGRVPGYKLPSYWRNATLEGKNALGNTAR